MTDSTEIPRRRLHRATFTLAGVYSVAWGLYAVIDPQWLFRFAGMAPMRHPQLLATLGMVVGLYGVLYLEVARVPERGWLLAAVGSAGKVLGPVGFVFVIASGAWPIETGVLVLTNDQVWLPPFVLSLHDAWPAFRSQFGDDATPT